MKKKILIQKRVQVPFNVTSNYHVGKKLNESLTNTYAWLLVVEYCTDIRTVTPNISQLIHKIYIGTHQFSIRYFN